MRCFVLLVFLLPLTAQAEPDRVLFVGNSFSFYNNGLQTHYRRFYEEAFPGEPNSIRMLSFSGARLSEHKGLRAAVGGEDWDAVILQGHSRGPLENFQGFRSAAKAHAKAIRKSGAKTFMFMTWAYTDQPEMTQLLADAYYEVAAEIDAEVVPVGIAFAVSARDRPDIALRTGDKKHPTLAGTYLTACMFFAVLTGESPVGMDYDAGLDRETAEFLQGVAWKTARASLRQP